MSEGLGGTLTRLDIESGGQRLGDAGVEGRGAGRDHQVRLVVIASGRPLAGARAEAERGGHDQRTGLSLLVKEASSV